MRLLTALLLTTAALSIRAEAQAPPDAAWEFVGADSAQVEGLTLIDPADGQPYGLAHPALVAFNYPNIPDYYAYSDGLYRLDDPAGGTTPPEPNPAWDLLVEFYEPTGLYADASGLIVGSIGSGPDPLRRSPDGGETWADVDSPGCGGDFTDDRITRTYGPGRARSLWLVGNLCRSDDDGATWAPVPQISAPSYLRRRDLLEMPPSAMLPEGRLVLGVGGGVILSDDDGSTWVASSLYQNFRWVGHSLTLSPDGSHPYGGTAYVLARDHAATTDQVTMLASDDGGATWEERRRFADGDFDLNEIGGEPEMTVLGDGSLVAGLLDPRGGSRGIDLGAVVWSGDGGVTWSPLGPVAPWQGGRPPDGVCNPACAEGAWPGWGAQLLRVDREGRIWAGTENGVWRTTGPAWAVAGEGGPEAPASVGVSVWPNPSGGAVTVGLSLASAQVVRVSVVDALGREVAVAFEGAARDGQQLSVDTEGWPAGAYTVRMATEAGGASAGLTVVR